MNTRSGARSTAKYPLPVIYPAIGLAGESGEVCEKIKKIIRDKNQDFTNTQDILAITKELGDVLWYVAMLASDLGVSLEEVAETNLSKLSKRKVEGKLGGSGDNR